MNLSSKLIEPPMTDHRQTPATALLHVRRYPHSSPSFPANPVHTETRAPLRTRAFPRADLRQPEPVFQTLEHSVSKSCPLFISIQLISSFLPSQSFAPIKARSSLKVNAGARLAGIANYFAGAGGTSLPLTPTFTLRLDQNQITFRSERH